MNLSRKVLVVASALGLLGGGLIAGRGTSPAQAQGAGSAAKTATAKHISEAMFLPARLPFAKPTSLEEVVAHLRKETGSNVVLDLAALGRRKLTPASKVQLDLEGVRLKTGLKLLLDQVNLTTKIVAEDNLLIITDRSEADDAIVRLTEEIKELHRDVHAIQDEIREVRAMLAAPPEEDEPAAKMRTPTIIEDLPAEGAANGKEEPKTKKEKSPSRTRPGL